jgi:hypothetical protein
MVDASARTGQANLQSDLSFIQCVVNTLSQIGPNNIQVALQTYGSTVIDTFFFNRYTTLSALSAAITSSSFLIGGNANIALAMNDMLANYYQSSASGYRLNRPHVAVLLTHGPSQAALTPSPTGTASGDAIYTAGLAKAQCIDIIGVGAYINDANAANYISELSSISSSYSTLTTANYFTATSYSALTAQCSAVAQQILACVNCGTLLTLKYISSFVVFLHLLYSSSQPL